jgi:hypothetical protein
MGIHIPADYQGGGVETKEEIPLSIKSASIDQGTSSKGPWSDKRERRRKGLRQTSGLVERKNEKRMHTHKLETYTHAHAL